MSHFCTSCGRELIKISFEDKGTYEKFVGTCYNTDEHPRLGFEIIHTKTPEGMPDVVKVNQYELEEESEY